MTREFLVAEIMEQLHVQNDQNERGTPRAELLQGIHKAIKINYFKEGKWSNR
jgi:hypothetical protein